MGLGVSGKVPGLGFEDSAGFFFPRNVGGFTPPSGLEISWEKPSSRNFPGHHPRKFLYLPFPRLGDGKGNYRFGTGSHFVGRSNDGVSRAVSTPRVDQVMRGPTFWHSAEL